jgi:arabinofuranosyltransferase
MPAVAPAPPRSVARDVAVALAVALLPYLWLVGRFNYLSDDAFINFRYAKNLADGWGLTFNPNDGPKVEGYNCLWTLLMAIPERLGWNTPLWSKVGTIASGLALLAYVVFVARARIGLGAFGTVAVALFLATLGPFVVYSTSGMEAMPAALALFATYERLLGDPERPRGWQAGFCAAIAELMRPDGGLLAMVVLVAGALCWLQFRRRALLRALLQAGFVLLACIAAHTAFRLAYHGDWIPNTVRIKGQMSLLFLERGWDYLVSLMLTLPGLLVVLAFAPVALSRAQRERMQPIALILAVLTAYLVFVGADFMPMGRFLLAALPFFALAFAGVLRAWEERGTRLGLRVGFCALCIGLSAPAVLDRHVVPLSLRERFDFRWGQGFYVTEFHAWERQKANTERWTLEGRALALHTHPGESLIRGPIGAAGYYTDLAIYDTFGLTDREVARLDIPPRATTAGHTHEVSPDFFLEDKPTFRTALLVSGPGQPRPIFTVDPATYAVGLMVKHEPYALDPALGFEPNSTLILERLVPIDADFDLLLPFCEAARDVELSSPESAEATLAARIPLDSPAVQRLAARARERLDHPDGPLSPPAGEAAANRPPKTGFKFVTEVWLLGGAGKRRRAQDGEIHLCLPLAGDPKFLDRAPGWIVIAPGQAHTPVVEGGVLAILSLRPETAVSLEH